MNVLIANTQGRIEKVPSCSNNLKALSKKLLLNYNKFKGEVQMDNKIQAETLLEAIDIRKRFFEIYNTTGVISIDSSFGIHLTKEHFLDTFSEYEVRDRCDSRFVFELTADFNGEKFFCITHRIKESEEDERI
jgi:hypothetical protein